MNKQDLFTKLINLDSEVAQILSLDTKIPITIVGGSAFIMRGYLDRITYDIDIIDLFYPKLLPIMERYSVNSRSEAFCDCLAYNYEDRLVKLDIKTKILDFYTLSLEDLVIMKLFSDRGKDLNDIREPEVVKNLNWDLLDEIITSGEADVSFNQLRYKHFLQHYDEYKKECKK